MAAGIVSLKGTFELKNEIRQYVMYGKTNGRLHLTVTYIEMTLITCVIYV